MNDNGSRFAGDWKLKKLHIICLFGLFFGQHSLYGENEPSSYPNFQPVATALLTPLKQAEKFYVRYDSKNRSLSVLSGTTSNELAAIVGTWSDVSISGFYVTPDQRRVFFHRYAIDSATQETLLLDGDAGSLRKIAEDLVTASNDGSYFLAITKTKDGAILRLHAALDSSIVFETTWNVVLTASEVFQVRRTPFGNNFRVGLGTEMSFKLAEALVDSDSKKVVVLFDGVAEWRKTMQTYKKGQSIPFSKLSDTEWKDTFLRDFNQSKANIGQEIAF